MSALTVTTVAYGGMILEGPLAGRWIDHHAETLTVRVDPLVNLGKGLQGVLVGLGDERTFHIVGIVTTADSKPRRFWVPEQLKDADAMDYVFNRLIRGFAPSQAGA